MVLINKNLTKDEIWKVHHPVCTNCDNKKAMVVYTVDSLVKDENLPSHWLCLECEALISYKDGLERVRLQKEHYKEVHDKHCNCMKHST